ncbi:MAG TPA: hypothetical protein VKN16_15460 [Methylomirabilota bacterium]|jgi:hypothetical protein|nr:hypothetical protein [Methylomirabilota bacterium]
MSAPDIPTEYTIHIENVDNDLLSNIRIMEVQPVTLQGGATAIKTESRMEGGTNPIKTESKVETDSSISIMKLPQIDLQLGMRPTRVHMPVGLKFCVSLLGMPLVSFDVCGESMVIVEDYTPHRTELCA